MSKQCETCGALPPLITNGPWAGQRHLLRFCAHCSKNLCEKCLATRKCRDSKTGKHEADSEDVEWST